MNKYILDNLHIVLHFWEDSSSSILRFINSVKYVNKVEFKILEYIEVKPILGENKDFIFDTFV